MKRMGFNTVTKKVCAFGLLIFVGYSPASAELLGYWNFNDASNPTTAIDFSGHGNHGEIIAANRAASGGGFSGQPGDRALDLGTSALEAYVNIPNAASGAFDSIVQSDSATISLWLYGSDEQPVDQWTFWFGPGRQLGSHVPWGDSVIYFDVAGCCDSTSRIEKHEPNTSKYKGQWNHYAFVKDHEYTAIFQNGSLFVDSGTDEKAPLSTITEFFIGAGPDFDRRSYSGLIDDVAVWDEALSRDEISRLANGENPFSAPAGLLTALETLHGKEGADRAVEAINANLRRLAATPVPEPSAFALFGIAMVILTGKSRRGQLSKTVRSPFYPTKRTRRHIFLQTLETRLTLSATSSLIPNGDFETGELSGFTASGLNDGFAMVVEEGSCFSANDTTGITLNGDFAANVRSSGPAPTDSVGILTSDLFVAGSELTFRALSENDVDAPASDPVTLEVRLLDAADNLLSSQVITTNIVTLQSPCGGAPINGTFSTHAIPTTGFLGESIRVQFRQHTNVSGKGFFTLVDDISIVLPVEIDVRPGGDPNSIKLGSNGVIAVAILSTSIADGDTTDFDATSVDESTIEFGDARDGFPRVKALRSAATDVDADGDLDLIVHFSEREIRESGALDADSVDAILAAQTLAGAKIGGADSVRIVR
jgi:hypothetical protein